MDRRSLTEKKLYHLYDVANDHIDFEFPIRFDISYIANIECESRKFKVT